MPTITVTDMACTGCEATVESALEELPRVERASADHEAGTVAVAGDADEATLAEAIRAAGYEPA